MDTEPPRFTPDQWWKAPDQRRRPVALAVTVIGIVAVVLVLRHITAGPGSGSDTGPSGTHQVRYTVTGTAGAVNLTYSTDSGGIEQHSGTALPADPVVYGMPSGATVTLSAQNTGDFGDVTCMIEVDGSVISRTTSTGGYAIASCSGQVP